MVRLFAIATMMLFSTAVYADSQLAIGGGTLTAPGAASGNGKSSAAAKAASERSGVNVGAGRFGTASKGSNSGQ